MIACQCTPHGRLACRLVGVLGELLAGRSRFDGLDVVHAAAIPSRAEPRAARRGDAIEQVRHWAVGSVLRDQFIATVGGSPIAFAAANENGRALLVAQRIDRDCATAMSTASYPPCARVRENVSPPILARGLLRMRP